MKIEVHSLLHNDAQLIPYFVLHYSQFADIYFYESNSTDGSREIAEILGAHVIDFPMPYEIDERNLLTMKNNCWKNSKADWVMLTDSDEVIYHPHIVSILEKTQYTMFRPAEWLMCAKNFPATNGQIYDEVKYGVPGFPGHNKTNIFRPDQIKEMNYDAGCHSCNPVGNIRLCTFTDIITMHFHYITLDYRLRKNAEISARLSYINKQMGWGANTQLPPERVKTDFEDILKRAVRVID